MEGLAVAVQPSVFGYELSYTSYSQFFNFKAEDIKPYETQDSVYKKYTSEQPPHIVFSDRIKTLTNEIIGQETNPYLKVKMIYEYIDKNFPWASAREYSTIENIPEYVLTNRHGDCGQVSLLFITMARCAGVPAKWQSGWMMHPGNKNLHDWAEVYYPEIGWVPVDQSFGRVKGAIDNQDAYYFFTKGLDAYRMIVNDNISGNFYPAKIHSRSETVDFQRGEVEWRGENLYFGRWRYKMEIEYL
jgi:transglutaminase-like putative cysteine protease